MLFRSEVGFLGIEQVGEFATRGEAVDSAQERAGFRETGVRDACAVAKELHDRVILSTHKIGQVLNCDFLAAQLAVCVMDDADFQFFCESDS